MLKISDLRVKYEDGTEAITALSLNIPPGQRVALLGPNGAGKTTLFLAIMNALRFDGQIEVDGVEVARRTQSQVRSICGMTFQNADDQLFMPTLLDDVAFGPLNQGMSQLQAGDVAVAAIAAVGLAGVEGKSAHHLSGGQKRLASLATIFSMSVKMLLLDEPSSNLDFRSRMRLADLLASRSETMLLATHDLELAGRLCHRAVIMDAGECVADGEINAILSDKPLLSRCGLG